MFRGAVWGTQESREAVRDAEGVLGIPRKVELNGCLDCVF